MDDHNLSTEAAGGEGKQKERIAFQYSQMLERAEEPNLAPQRKLILAMELMAYGLVDKSRELCNGLPMGFEHERNRRLEFLDRMEEGEEVLAKVAAEQSARGEECANATVVADPRGGRRLTGVMIAPQPRPTNKAVMVFGGNADRNFPISPPILDIADAHVIIMKDPSRCFGLCDIPRLGNNFEGSVARLKAVLAELGVDQLYSLGFSSGGFAALKFALSMQAQGVLCFSTPTSLDIEDEPGSTISKYPQLSALYRKARHLGTSMVREYSITDPHPSAILMFGAEHQRDRYFAEHMGHVAGVQLEPLPGHSLHATFVEAVARGLFPAMLQRLMALKPVSNSAPIFAAAE